MTANTTPTPLVTRQALEAFTRRLVEQFAPEQVILFGSQALGNARWDSDADILVVMPFEGRPLDTVKAMRRACEPRFPLDLHLRRPEEIAPRYRWGDPFIREALDHGELLHGEAGRWPRDAGAKPSMAARNPVVDEWIERAERHWHMVELSADLQGVDLIAQGVESRKCRNLQLLSERLRNPIPGWQPEPQTLKILTQAALAYLDPHESHPEPSQNVAWAITQAGPLRGCLRRWFDSLGSEAQEVA